MVLALFSIYSNVSDVGKLSDFISCAYVLQERKVYKLYKGKCSPIQVSTTELLHPTDKMLKKGLWQNYNYTSNLFSAAVIKTTTKSAGNILLQCREIRSYFISCVLWAWEMLCPSNNRYIRQTKCKKNVVDDLISCCSHGNKYAW